MKALQSTLLHVIELTVVLGAGILLAHFFNLNSETYGSVISLILAALAKFTRASEKIPVKDYVNNRK